MKTYTKPATSKLVARFDNELKNILMDDLKAFRDRNKFTTSNKQAPVHQTLTVAAWSSYTRLPIEILTPPMKTNKAPHFAELYFFVAYFTIKAAVLADAPGLPIRSSSLL